MKKIFLSLILFLFFTLNVKAIVQYDENGNVIPTPDDGQMHILSEPYDETSEYTTDVNETLASTNANDKTLLYVSIGGGAVVVFALIGFVSTKLEKKNKKNENIPQNNEQKGNM